MQGEYTEVSHGRSLKDNNTKVFRKLFKGLRGQGAESLVGGLEGARVSGGHLGRKAKAPGPNRQARLKALQHFVVVGMLLDDGR